MLVGTKKLYTQVNQEITIRHAVLRQYCKGSGKKKKKKKRKNWKFVSVFLVAYSNIFNNSFVFFSLFWWLNTRYNMVLASTYHQKYPLRQLVLKTDVTVVQLLRLFILDFFLPWHPSLVIDTSILMQYKVTIKACYDGSDAYKNNCYIYFA